MRIVHCRHCGKQTNTPARRSSEPKRGQASLFCSIRCRYAFREERRQPVCAKCRKTVRKTPARKRSTGTPVFCSRSCAASYGRTPGKTGRRRSRWTIYFENQLRTYFPGVKVSFPAGKPAEAEPGFYFPDLRLVLEFDEYAVPLRPPRGSKRRRRLETNRLKTARDQYSDVELHVFDVSRESRLRPKFLNRHWLSVKNLIASRTEMFPQTGFH